MDRLNYYWRLVATGINFVSFGVGGLLLSLTIFPIIYCLPCPLETKSRQARCVIRYSFKAFVRLMEITGVMSLNISGHDSVQKGGHLIIANHPTLIDVVVLISLLPDVDCIVKQALWRNPFLTGVVKAAQYISNDEPEIVLAECVKRIQKGASIIVFPEGTRSVPGQPLKFQRGAANIALRSGCDIRTVYISCEPHTLTKANKWFQIPPRRFHINIVMGELMDIKKFNEKWDNYNLASRKLNECLEQHYTEELCSNGNT